MGQRCRVNSLLIQMDLIWAENLPRPPNTHWSITRPLACPWNWEISLGGKNDVKYIGKWWKKWSKICLNQKRRRKSSEIPPLWREFSNVRGTVVLSLWGRWIFYRNKLKKTPTIYLLWKLVNQFPSNNQKHAGDPNQNYVSRLL